MTIKPHRAYGKMGSPPDIPGNATVLFKLELLSFTKKADVSEKRDGSVLKHVVHEGEGGTDVFSLPNKRCDIYYSYKLRLPYDGTVEPLDEEDDAEWLAEDAEHGTPVGLRLGLETMRRGERARFTMYADCHGVRGLPDLGLRPRDRIVYEVKDSSASSRPSSPRRDGSELDAASDRPSSNVPFRGFVGDAVRSESTSTDAGVGAQRGGKRSFTRTVAVAAINLTARSQFATAPTLQVLARFRDRSSLKTS